MKLPLSALLASTLSASSLGAQTMGPPVTLPTPPPKFEPWIFDQLGKKVWGKNLWNEEPTNTVRVLARDLVQLAGQDARDDVVHLNHALFWPPENVSATSRRFLHDSVNGRGIQLYVNYGDVRIDPASSTPTYQEATFFISQPPGLDTQTDPPVPSIGFSGATISATRGAFGEVAILEESVLGAPEEALYVTGGIGFDPATIDFGSFAASEIMGDRLFVRHQGVWSDYSHLIPLAVRERDNCGVAFLDVNGDGYQDIYVGTQGADFGGGVDSLLVYKPATGAYRVENARITEPAGMSAYAGATSDVVASDLDMDGDLDLAVSTRWPRSGVWSAGVGRNFVLVNDGAGGLDRIYLDADTETCARNSRSIAAGDLDLDLNGPQVSPPEIVVANAKSDGYDLDPEAYVNHALHHQAAQMYESSGSGAGMTFTDTQPTRLPQALEEYVSSPFNVQLLIEDYLNASKNYVPDGFNDLLFVNRREGLKHSFPGQDENGSVPQWCVATHNSADGLGKQVVAGKRFSTVGTRTACFGDFYLEAAPRDIFVGTGNVWSGLVSNIFPLPVVPDFDIYYDRLPGNERGYGFDFAHMGGTARMDGVQTSRAYNYVVEGFGDSNPAAPWHWQLDADAPAADKLEYRRGQSVPKTSEDVVIADFDGDDDLDFLLVGGPGSSDTHPEKFTAEGELPLSCFLWYDDLHGGPFLDGAFDHTEVPVTLGYDPGVFNPPPAPAQLEVFTNAVVDIGQRIGYPFPYSADRAVAGDLNNDGDVDALVQLFQSDSHIADPGTPIVTTTDAYSVGGWVPPDFFTVGWQMLVNQGNGTFQDQAPFRMHSDGGGFQSAWNRGLGMTLLLDLDNNGALDIYTSTAGFQDALNGLGNYTTPHPADPQHVQTVDQLRDLVFMNGVGGDPVGFFTEKANASPSILPANGLPADIAFPPNDGPAHDVPGSFGLAAGDVDNDGNVDVAVFHYSPNQKVANYPWLLINELDTTGALVDEFQSRVPISALDPAIHTPPVDLHAGGTPADGMDHATFGALLDFDGDGDLDLSYSVVRDLPRMLKNDGTGHFSDVTSSALLHKKPTTEAQDVQVVDIDSDGDLDLAFETFSDIPFFWRNVTPESTLPAVTDAWPRIGSIRGSEVRLHGQRLAGASEIRLSYGPATAPTEVVIPQAAISSCTAPGFVDCLSFDLPLNAPLGLARIRVKVGSDWSQLYFGYFVLEQGS